MGWLKCQNGRLCVGKKSINTGVKSKMNKKRTISQLTLSVIIKKNFCMPFWNVKQEYTSVTFLTSLLSYFPTLVTFLVTFCVPFTFQLCTNYMKQNNAKTYNIIIYLCVQYIKSKYAHKINILYILFVVYYI